jgi:hypothetical protein
MAAARISAFSDPGFLTDRIVAGVEGSRPRACEHGHHVALTATETNEIRGIREFRRRIETFNALRRIPGVSYFAGNGVGLQSGWLSNLRRLPRMPGSPSTTSI